MRLTRLLLIVGTILFCVFVLFLLVNLFYGGGTSLVYVYVAVPVVSRRDEDLQSSDVKASLATHGVDWSVELSLKPSIEQRGVFQQGQIDRYCRKHGHQAFKYVMPSNTTQEQLLYRHLLYDDKRKSLFCFVEKIGCTDMKRLLFVTAGLLPTDTTKHTWVDLKHLEKGIQKASLQNKNLTDAGRMERIRKYFKFMIVRNPLERLVSGYRNKIEPPLSDLSTKFPNYVKRYILRTYRPVDFQLWLSEGGRHNMSISFSEFVQYVIDTDPELLNPHFKPMIHTCHPCRVRYHFYGNFETYNTDLALIIEWLQTKPEYYPNRSLHTPGHETKTYLAGYYHQLTHIQKADLFYKLKDELEFYYHLYPQERDCHSKLLGIHEQLQVK